MFTDLGISASAYQQFIELQALKFHLLLNGLQMLFKISIKMFKHMFHKADIKKRC